jgi:hypothetical protein
MSKNALKHSVAAGHGLPGGGKPRWHRPPLPANGAWWMERRLKPPQVPAHSSHASPSTTGEVDGRVTLDGGAPDLVLA